MPGRARRRRHPPQLPRRRLRARDDTFTVADAYNCRILFVRAHAIVRQYGRSGDCAHDPPLRFGAVNGDTPTPAGGVARQRDPRPLGRRDRRRRRACAGRSRRPSATRPIPSRSPHDHVLLADYSLPGHVVVMNSRGDALWRYGPSTAGEARARPSLARARAPQRRHRGQRRLPRSRRRDRSAQRQDRLAVRSHRPPGTAPGYLRIPDGMDFIPADPGVGSTGPLRCTRSGAERKPEIVVARGDRLGDRPAARAAPVRPRRAPARAPPGTRRSARPPPRELPAGPASAGMSGFAKRRRDNPTRVRALLEGADRPYIPLLTTITTIARPSCAAVASSSPHIWKPPSPMKQTTVRSGWRSFAATAAGIAVAHRAALRHQLRAVEVKRQVAADPDAEVARVAGDDRLAGEPLSAVADRGAEVEVSGRRRRLAPFEVLAARLMVRARPARAVDRLDARRGTPLSRRRRRAPD